MSIIQGSAIESGAAGYQIEQSLRFNSADSAYLSRTFSTPTSNLTWTFSCWLKKTALTTGGGIFSESTGYAGIYFPSTDVLRVMDNSGGVAIGTTAVFRDPSAWGHLVVRSNGSNVKAYWNGSEVGSYAGTISLLNAATSHYVGRYSNAYFNGYLTEVNFIDGQALDPTSFGEYNSTTGVWQPIAYAGTYGTNGFYLNFSDNSDTTSTTLGKDYSGNSNNWTPNLFSVTAGAGNDSLVDTPTPYGTDAQNGGEVRGNYATLNPLDKNGGSTVDGNLNFTNGAATSYMAGSTIVPTMPIYAEFQPTGWGNGNIEVGLRTSVGATNTLISDSGGVSYNFRYGTVIYNGSTQGTYTAATGTSSVVMMAYDPSSGKLWFGLNGTWFNSGNPAAGTGQVYTITTPTSAWRVFVQAWDTTNAVCANFGQRPFSYTAPSGFKCLCTTNLPDPAIADGSAHFNTIVWNGNGTSQAITGLGFQPDLVWAKSTDANSGQNWVDSVRGATKNLQTNNSGSPSTSKGETTANTVISFDSDGFTVGDGLGLDINKGGEVIIGRCWKASNSTTNIAVGSIDGTNPTIASTVSANPTAGFSIVTYTGINANATVAHGLSPSGFTNVPQMVITKRINTDGYDWTMYHAGLPSADYAIYLNLLDGQANEPTAWNSTAPTSQYFSIGTRSGTGSAGNFVAYVFAPIAGYSAFGSYRGAPSKTFVYTGFRPALVILKKATETSTSYGWPTVDNLRPPTVVGKTGYNPTLEMWVDQSVGEATSSSYGIDLLSNGFCINVGGNTNINDAGKTFIYAAFAENPFKYSLAR